MSDTAEFDHFVVARSHALLRTAYFLVRDEGLAEDLLQTALTRAWFAWGGIEGDPERHVRGILVNTAASWRRRWHRELPTDVLPERGGTAGGPPAGDQDLWDAGGLAANQAAGGRAAVPGGPQRGRDRRPDGCSRGTVKSQCSKSADQTACRPCPSAGRREEPAMNTADLRSLADRAEGIQGRPSARLRTGAGPYPHRPSSAAHRGGGRCGSVGCGHRRNRCHLPTRRRRHHTRTGHPVTFAP